MKSLSELITNLDILEITGDTTINISSLNFDSKSVVKGSVFVAIKGTMKDGHDFIDNAIGGGASVIIYDKKSIKKNLDATYVLVRDSRTALADLAQNFYNHPSKKLKLVGITGTNGKTTIATLLFNLFENLGYSCALLSTIENKIGKKTYPTNLTTPDPITIASFLDQAVSEGCQYAFMECSSHAISQKRVWGLEFAGAVFTNLTHDHLDYHKTMETYAQSKKKLFDTLPKNSFAVVNQDDVWGEYMVSQTQARKYFFSLKDKKFKQSLEGLEISWEDKKIKSKLIGIFNAYNIFEIYATAKLLEIPENKIISTIAQLNPPSGRLEFIKSKKGVIGVIDYAHTPDALENVLKTIKELMPEGSKIITVVGCSGERDKLKRPIMGKIAYKLSDYVIFSSDNPKSENSRQILKEMTINLPSEIGKYECESDRAKAIAIAFERAKTGDVILMAGKGHENYQYMKDGKIPFSEKEQWEIVSK